MARIEGVPITLRHPLLWVAAWLSRRRFGRNMEPLRGCAWSNPVMFAMAGLEMAMDRARRVDGRLRGLAELRVAALVGCPFCLDIGSAIVQQLGVSPEQVTDLNRYRDSAAFSAGERAVLEYTDRMTSTPVTVRDEDVERLRQFLDVPQIVELTAAIAHENLRARINHALGYGAEGFSTGAVCALPASAASGEPPMRVEIEHASVH